MTEQEDQREAALGREVDALAAHPMGNDLGRAEARHLQKMREDAEYRVEFAAAVESLRLAGVPQSGASMIAEERLRQIEEEGYDKKHDDNHAAGQLAMAAVAYAIPMTDLIPNAWPWDAEEFKKEAEGFITPSPGGDKDRAEWIYGRTDDLVKAGALIAAEIDRLGRIPINGDD